MCWAWLAGATTPGAEAAAAAGAAQVSLVPLARIVEDRRGDMTADDVLALPADAGMTEEHGIVGFGFSGSAYWFSLAVDNPEAQPLQRLLVFQPTWLDDLRVVLVAPDGSRRDWRGGDRLPFGQRALPHPKPNFELTLPPGRSRLLVRVQTRDPFLVGMTLESREAFFAADAREAGYTWFLYGAMGALLLFNLVLFFSARERVHAAYVAYLAAFLVMHATYNGHLYPLLWPDSPAWGNWAHSTFIYLFMLAGLSFAIRFLDLRTRLPRAYRWARGLALAIAAAGLLTALAGYGVHVASSILWVIVHSPAMLALGVLSLLSGNRAARFFLPATAAGFVGAFVTASAVSDLLPYSFFTYRAVDFGMLIDAVLLSLALADRLRLSRAEADRAKAELIETTRSHAHQLEETVAARTGELHQALTELKERDRAKSHFFAAASHDLRQPIHAMGLFLDALKKADDREERLRFIRSIETASGSLNELLDSLLDISKLDAGAVVPQPAPVEVATLFAEIDLAFSPLALHRGLRFKLWFPARALTLDTDRRLLNMVLSNIIGNALKHTARGGILVALRPRRGRWVLQVWDTGVGISGEHLARIYDEYFQVNNPNRDRAKGLGLGLSIARRVCALLGCELACRSRPGRGTVFEIRLPAAAVGSAAALPAPAAEETVDPAEFRGQRLAVLEDDRLVAEALAGWLAAHGIEAAVYGSAESALADPTIADADGYIVDYQLAGRLTGLDFLHALQGRYGRPQRAVLVSGNTSGGFIEAVGQAPWPHLFKPASPARILARLGAP